MRPHPIPGVPGDTAARVARADVDGIPHLPTSPAALHPSPAAGAFREGFILALDPGARLGWACSDWTCGTLDLSAPFARDRGEALGRFAEWLRLYLHGARLLVIERPFGRAAFTSDLPGIIAARAHEVAFRAGVRRREFGVSAIRKATLGKGNAAKAQVKPAMLAAGWPCRNDHEADACAVLMAAIEAAKAGENLAA